MLPLSGCNQGCIFFYSSPHLVGGGEESKGLRAREENQRVKKNGRAGGKEEKNNPLSGNAPYF